VALAARELTRQEPVLSTIELGIAETSGASLPQMMPGICPVEAIFHDVSTKVPAKTLIGNELTAI
jgi:hypothetical protein